MAIYQARSRCFTCLVCCAHVYVLKCTETYPPEACKFAVFNQEATAIMGHGPDRVFAAAALPAELQSTVEQLWASARQTAWGTASPCSGYTLKKLRRLHIPKLSH